MRGPFSTPITPLPGSLFHADPQSRSQQRQLAALNVQVAELKSVNGTLKTYLEEVLSSVKPETSENIIKNEETKLERAREDIHLGGNAFYRYLTKSPGLSDAEARAIISKPSSADEAVDLTDSLPRPNDSSKFTSSVLRRIRAAQLDFNKARKLLGKDNIDFSTSSHLDVVRTSARVSVHKDVKDVPASEDGARAAVGTTD